MPESGMAHNYEQAVTIANEIGYPVMVRPSYVLGGRAMEVVFGDEQLKNYIENELRQLKDAGATVMASAVGRTEEEYAAVCDGLKDTDVDLIELNISCPNVKQGGVSFGTDPGVVKNLVREIKKASGKKPLVVKLTPNVTDIAEIAVAAVEGGADALSLINTLKGKRIDIKTKKPVLTTGSGGLSGPAIFPIAVHMVSQVRQAVSVPIIGMGGVMTGEDAFELMLAGADAVAVGTAALIDPAAPVKILSELEDLFDKNIF